MKGQNLTYIPGELTSAAVDGVVASAEVIKDYRKGKSIEEVNIEVDDALGERYTKEETYSKEEIDNLITPISELIPIELCFRTNKLSNELFEGLSSWQISGDVTIQSGLTISGKGVAEQQSNIIVGHTYALVCCVKITSITGITKGVDSYNFYGKVGAGVRIQGTESSLYKEVFTSHITDYMPIIYIFRAYSTEDVNIYVGSFYDQTHGSITGDIKHVGFYDITVGVNEGINFKVVRNAYNKRIKNLLGIDLTLAENNWPDSLSKDMFIDELNARAKCYGLLNTQFFTPSGVLSYLDKYRDSISYSTILQGVEDPDTFITHVGTFSPSEETSVWKYSINTQNIYMLSGVYISTPNQVAIVAFFKGENLVYVPENFTVRSMISKFDEETRQNVDFVGYEVLVIPQGDCDTLAVMSDSDHVPTLRCISYDQLDATSVVINSTNGYDNSSFRRNSNISCCHDLAILAGVSAFGNKYASIWSMQHQFAMLYDPDEMKYLDETVQMHNLSMGTFTSKYLILSGKGGSNHTTNLGSKEVGWALAIKDRETNRVFGVSLMRMDYLPNYNEVDVGGVPTVVTDEVLQSDYPDIYARKLLNNGIYGIYSGMIEAYKSGELYDYSLVDWDSCAICEIDPAYTTTFNTRRFPGIKIGETETPYLDCVKGTDNLFQGKDMYKAIHPLSTTKIITSLVALDYLNFNDFLRLRIVDITGGSGHEYESGDTFTVQDAIITMQSVSDNTIASALARMAGEKMIESRFLI